MAKKYFPIAGERFKVFIKIPAWRGQVFRCTGRCYCKGHFSCIAAKGKGDRKPKYAFNRQDFVFEKVE